MNALPYDYYLEERKKTIMQTNIEAPIALITAFSKGMINKGTGRIISIASIAGEMGHPDIWYSVTKAGIINMT